MKKEYNFIVLPYSENLNFDLQNNPFSSIDGTLELAWQWAKNLIKFNPVCTRVIFQSVNGRKIYYLENNGE